MNMQKSIIYGLLLVIAQSSYISYSMKANDTAEEATIVVATPVTKKSVAANLAVLQWAYDYNKFFNSTDEHRCYNYRQTKEKILLPKTELAALFLFYGAAGASYMYALRNNMIEPSTLVKNLAPILGSAIVARLARRLCKPFLLKRTANKLFNDPSLPNEMRNLIGKVERGETYISKKGKYLFALKSQEEIQSDFFKFRKYAIVNEKQYFVYDL